MENIQDTYAVTQSFTLSLAQVAKLADLQDRLGVKRSEIVRRAIDLFYEQINQVEAQPEAEPTK